MATYNKNTNLKPLKKYFKGKGTIEFIPLNSIPKEGTTINDLRLYSHWVPLKKAPLFNVECNPEGICPICELLKPKTKWQKIKERISKLWKLLNL